MPDCGSDIPDCVSVIIPNLNSPLLAQVVRAVRDQAPSGIDLDVIVAGLDEIGLAVEAGARYVTLGRPLTPGAARNLGVRSSRGEYLIFLDADCIPQAGWLAGLLSYWSPTQRVAVSGAMRIVPDTYMRRAGNLAAFREHTAGLPVDDRPFLASFSLALPRRAFVEVGWFNERLPRAEDLDYTIRLSRAGYRLRFDRAITVVHRPSRVTLGSLLRHAFASGQNSVRVRERYPAAFGVQRWLLRWPLLLGFGPAMAAMVTFRALRENPDVRAYRRALPVLYLSRLAWCLGAASELHWRQLGNPFSDRPS